MLGLELLSLHNIYFFLQTMRNIRQAIQDDKFQDFKKDFFGTYANWVSA
jgi:queuine tRNA-ribosyltransferase